MPRKLKKAGTMQQVTAEGTEFLKRSWGEAQYDLVKRILDSRDEALTSAAAPADSKAEEPAPKKAKLVKSGTMAVTTKVRDGGRESEAILKGADIDGDAKTRNQAKVISSITKAKPKISKKKTMIATAKESEEILKDANIDVDAKTRNQAKAISSLKAPKPSNLAKKKTMLETAKESQVILKDVKIDSDAKTRNQSKQILSLTTPKPAKLKKSSTMTATAQEALNLLTQEPLRPRNSKAPLPKKPKKKAKRLQPKKKSTTKSK